MNWRVVTDSIFSVVVYLAFTCSAAYLIASCESAWAVRVPDKVRKGLLIFYFRRSKISVMAVVSQIFTYILLSCFLISRFGWAQDWLIKYLPNANQISAGALRFQFALIVIALVEERIYWLRKRRAWRAWLKKNAGNVTLEIYYASPYIATRDPWTKADLMGSGETRHITVDNETIKEHEDFICQMLDTPAVPVDDPDAVHLDARVYYALCGEDGEALFEVAMWGMEEADAIFINGVPCTADPIFYIVAMAFLPPDAGAEFTKFLEGQGAGQRGPKAGLRPKCGEVSIYVEGEALEKLTK